MGKIPGNACARMAFSIITQLNQDQCLARNVLIIKFQVQITIHAKNALKELMKIQKIAFVMHQQL